MPERRLSDHIDISQVNNKNKHVPGEEQKLQSCEAQKYETKGTVRAVSHETWLSVACSCDEGWEKNQGSASLHLYTQHDAKTASSGWFQKHPTLREPGARAAELGR